MFKEQYKAYQQHIAAPEDFTERLMEKRKRRKAFPIALAAPLCLLLILYIAKSGPGFLPGLVGGEAPQSEPNFAEEAAPESAEPADAPMEKREDAMEEVAIDNLESAEDSSEAERTELPRALIPPEGYLVEEGEVWVLYTDRGTIEFALTSQSAEDASEGLEYFYTIDGVTVRVRPEKVELLEILYKAPYFLKEEE